MPTTPMPTAPVPPAAAPAIRVACYTRVAALSRTTPSNLAQREQRLARYITAHGWRLVDRYTDIGAATTVGPGLAGALAAADAGRVQLLVVDDPSRLACDPRLLRWLLDRLAAAGVTVHPLTAAPPRPTKRRGLYLLATAAILDLLGG